MIELLQSMSYWTWISFGCLLLAAELLGTAGYMLWLGISAISIGILLFITPVTWQWQWMLFSIIAIVTTFVWWKIQHNNDSAHRETSTLNQKEKSFIGYQQMITQELPQGKSRFQIGDTTWPIICETPIEAGSTIEVVKMDGITLYIKKVD